MTTGITIPIALLLLVTGCVDEFEAGSNDNDAGLESEENISGYPKANILLDGDIMERYCQGLNNDIQLTGVLSIPSEHASEIFSYSWRFITKPPSSMTEIVDPTAETISFVYGDDTLPLAGGRSLGLDVVGHYDVGLIVTDDSGVSSEETIYNLYLQPCGELTIELTWDKSRTDLDLMLYKDTDGDFCPIEPSDSLCYFQNCTTANSNRPDMDGDGIDGRGDPSLDIDNTSGYGPEVINVSQPADGVYDVVVNYYQNMTEQSPETMVTLRIFLSGVLTFETSRIVAEVKDLVHIARLNWQNGSADGQEFSDITDGTCGG